jgi:hypothetical protein
MLDRRQETSMDTAMADTVSATCPRESVLPIRLRVRAGLRLGRGAPAVAAGGPDVGLRAHAL